MAPTTAELEEAEPWLSEQDANPMWPDHVHATLDDLRGRLGHGVVGQPGDPWLVLGAEHGRQGGDQGELIPIAARLIRPGLQCLGNRAGQIRGWHIAPGIGQIYVL